MRQVLPAIFVALLPVAASAAPPATEATAQAWIQAEVFGRGQYLETDDDDFNEFVLDRAEVGIGLRRSGLGGALLNFESVRSATPESLFGVDGNSLIVRAKHAFAFADPVLGPGRLRLAAGLIADPWITTLEDGYRLRAARPQASESSGFFDTSDLGASASYALWDGVAELTVAWMNGEGRNQVEQNTGKNATVVASVRPWKPIILGSEATLALHVVWRDGSVGQGFAPNHRLGGAVTLTHPSLGAGVEFISADGTQDLDVPAQVIAGWVDVDVYSHWLGVFVAAESQTFNTDMDDTSRLRLEGGLYSDVVERTQVTSWRHDVASEPGLSRLRIILHGRTDTYGDSAGAVVGSPGLSDVYQIMLTAEAAGLVF